MQRSERVMSFWRNLKIGLKVYSGFIAVLVVLVALGFFAISNLGVINDQSSEIADNWLPSVEYVSALNTAAGDYRSAQGEFIIADTDDDMKEAADGLTKVEAQIAELRKQYETMISSDQERALYQQFNDAWAKYMETSAKVFALEKADSDKEAAALFINQSDSEYEAASGMLDQLVDMNSDGAKA